MQRAACFPFFSALTSVPDTESRGFGSPSKCVSTVVVPVLGRCQIGPPRSVLGGRGHLRDIRQLRNPLKQAVQLVT